jgi:hypothetical protein
MRLWDRVDAIPAATSFCRGMRWSARIPRCASAECAQPRADRSGAQVLGTAAGAARSRVWIRYRVDLPVGDRCGGSERVKRDFEFCWPAWPLIHAHHPRLSTQLRNRHRRRARAVAVLETCVSRRLASQTRATAVGPPFCFGMPKGLLPRTNAHKAWRCSAHPGQCARSIARRRRRDWR